jgi:hypothetical protein
MYVTTCIVHMCDCSMSSSSSPSAKPISQLFLVNNTPLRKKMKCEPAHHIVMRSRHHSHFPQFSKYQSNQILIPRSNPLAHLSNLEIKLVFQRSNQKWGRNDKVWTGTSHHSAISTSLSSSSALRIPIKPDSYLVVKSSGTFPSFGY